LRELSSFFYEILNFLKYIKLEGETTKEKRKGGKEEFRK